MNISHLFRRSLFCYSITRKFTLAAFFLLLQFALFAGVSSVNPAPAPGANSSAVTTSQGAASGKAVASGKLTDAPAHANSAAGDVKPEGENVALQVGISAAVIIVICLIAWMMSSGPKKSVVKGDPSNGGGGNSSSVQNGQHQDVMQRRMKS